MHGRGRPTLRPASSRGVAPAAEARVQHRGWSSRPRCPAPTPHVPASTHLREALAGSLATGPAFRRPLLWGPAGQPPSPSSLRRRRAVLLFSPPSPHHPDLLPPVIASSRRVVAANRNIFTRVRGRQGDQLMARAVSPARRVVGHVPRIPGGGGRGTDGASWTPSPLLCHPLPPSSSPVGGMLSPGGEGCGWACAPPRAN